ncbi:hypothetical protein Tco_0781018 [Tanacetum coccineum]
MNVVKGVDVNKKSRPFKSILKKTSYNPQMNVEAAGSTTADQVKDSNSYLKSRGSIEDFVSFREMITSQLQGKLWLYDEVRMRLCLFCHHQIGEDCWDS